MGPYDSEIGRNCKKGEAMVQQNQPPIRVIALALHMTIFIYVFVVFFLASQGQWTFGWTLGEGKEIIVLILAFAASINGTLSLFLPRLLKGMAPPPSVPYEVNEAPLFFDFSNVTPKLLSLTIVRMALAEAVAIFGLVAAFLNQAAYWVLPFAAAGLILQVLVGPFGRYLRGA
jgi:hypothetical protein